MAVNENGKYTKKDALTLKKLEEAFSMDFTIEQACFYANISEQTYYNWTNDDDKLKKRLELLKQNGVMKAKRVVLDKIDESYGNAMDYLKRKNRKEFGDNMDLSTLGKEINNYTDEQIQRIAKRVADNGGNASEEKPD